MSSFVIKKLSAGFGKLFQGVVSHFKEFIYFLWYYDVNTSHRTPLCHDWNGIVCTLFIGVGTGGGALYCKGIYYHNERPYFKSTPPPPPPTFNMLPTSLLLTSPKVWRRIRPVLIPVSVSGARLMGLADPPPPPPMGHQSITGKLNIKTQHQLIRARSFDKQPLGYWPNAKDHWIMCFQFCLNWNW